MTENLRQRDGDQPLPAEGRENVQDVVIESLEGLIEQHRERRDLGAKRYGRPLQTFNGRDAVRDAFEEAVDLSVYLMQIDLEMKALKRERDYLAQSLSDALDRPVDMILEAARAALAKEMEAQEAAKSPDWAVLATYPVEEVAVHPDSLDALKDRLKITQAEKRVGGEIGEYFGFPLVTDSTILRAHIYMRPRQRQV